MNVRLVLQALLESEVLYNKQIHSWSGQEAYQARKLTTHLSTQIEVRATRFHHVRKTKKHTVNAILAQEVDAPDFSWLLLTNRPISTKEANRILLCPLDD